MKKTIVLIVILAGCSNHNDHLSDVQLRNKYGILKNNVSLKTEADLLNERILDYQNRFDSFLSLLSDDELSEYVECEKSNAQNNRPAVILHLRKLNEFMDEKEWSLFLSLSKEHDDLITESRALVEKENRLIARRKAASRDAFLRYQSSQNYMNMLQNNYNNQLMLNALYGIQGSITNLQR